MKKSAILNYAWRSIVRQKARNFFIIFIVCLTCVFSLFTASLFEGKNKQIKKNIIETETGHWQLLEKNFFTKRDPFSPKLFSQKEALTDYLSTPELIVITTILHPEGAQELNLIGIEPVSHEEVFPFKPYVNGLWPLRPGNHKEVVIGKNFAEKLRLSIHDEIVITYQDKNRAILNESLTVVGIYHHYGQGFEGHYAYVTREFLQTLLDLPQGNYFHRVIISPLKKHQAPDLKPQEGELIHSWDELHPELNVMMKFHNGVTRALVVFMLIIAYISIMTPIHILWDERRDEVRLLQTLGTQERTLYLMSGVEALVVTMLSLLFALLIWASLIFYGMSYGMNFSFMGEMEVVRGGILISNVVYPVVSWSHTLLIVLFHGAIIFGCSFFSIKKLLKSEAIRDER